MGSGCPLRQAAARARCTAGAAVKASAVHLIVAAGPVPLRASCTAGSCLLQSPLTSRACRGRHRGSSLDTQAKRVLPHDKLSDVQSMSPLDPVTL